MLAGIIRHNMSLCKNTFLLKFDAVRYLEHKIQISNGWGEVRVAVFVWVLCPMSGPDVTFGE